MALSQLSTALLQHAPIPWMDRSARSLPARLPVASQLGLIAPRSSWRQIRGYALHAVDWMDQSGSRAPAVPMAVPANARRQGVGHDMPGCTGRENS